MAETLWGATAPTNHITDEGTSGDGYSLGNVFRFAVSGQITHVRWYRHANDSSTSRTVRVWSIAGTQLASGTGSTSSTSAWNEVALSSALSVTAGTFYVASVDVPEPCDYSTFPGLGVSGLDNGANVEAPSSAEVTTGDQGRYVEYTGTPSFPTETFNNEGYAVDVIFEASDAPTYFGSASVPADGASATNATTTLTITPPGSMAAGDLVVVICQSRGATTWSVGVDGGQSWTAEAEYNAAANCDARIFWCTFDGTWDANPRFDSTSGTCTSAIMHVFRVPGGTPAWAIDVAQDADTFTAPSSPFTVTRTGLTTSHANTITLACFHTADDNTWGSLSGTGWAVAGTAQYRNTSSTDQSAAFAWFGAENASTSVPDVSLNQATLGGDAGVTAIIAWYATAAEEAAPFKPIMWPNPMPRPRLLGGGSPIIRLQTTAFREGAGAAVAAITVAATGQSTASGAGSAAGAITVAAAGQSTAAGAGDAAAAITVTATGQAVKPAAASVATGVTVAATGQTIAPAAGAAAAAITVAAVSDSSGFAAGAGAVDAAITVAAVGQAIKPAAGSAASSITVAATGQSEAQAAGTVSSAIAVAATGQTEARAAGTVSAAITVAATGQAIAQGAGAVDAAITVAAVSDASGFVAGAGAVDAAITVAAVGQSEAQAAGAITSAVTIAAGGAAIKPAAGSAAAAISVAAAGRATASGAGSAAGAITVAAAGQSIASGAGQVAASITVTGASQGTIAGAGSVASAITVAAAGQAIKPAAGAVVSSASTAAVGTSISAGGVVVASTIIVSAVGQSIASAAGTVSSAFTVSAASLTGTIEGAGAIELAFMVNGAGQAVMLPRRATSAAGDRPPALSTDRRPGNFSTGVRT